MDHTPRLFTGPEGLPCLALAHPDGSRAEIYLHGAHVASWQPAGGGEALYLSPRARFGEGEAIRGGIPVIFPQFADRGPLPKHGFARTQPWTWLEREGSATQAVLELRDSADTRALWPYAFRARLAVALEARSLALAFSVENTGAAPFAFTAALHTYLRVADVRQAALRGLEGVTYRDRGAQTQQPDPSPVLTVTGETDRLYLDAPPAVEVEGGAGGRRFAVEKTGFADWVVWNPWQALSAALPDLPDSGFLEMLCVEAAQAGTPVALAPGEAWQGTQRVSVAG